MRIVSLPVTWIAAALRLLLVLAANAIPIWGFTEEQWTPGTTLALYWVQSAAMIPITAGLIVLHRRLTRKLGHYRGVTVIEGGGASYVARSTYLREFLTLSLPLLAAHGVALALILGVWRGSTGAVDLDDLLIGTQAMAVILGLGFASDMLHLAHRPFAWVRRRAQALLQRTLIVHLTIIFGMFAAAFATDDAARFFGVFLLLKLVADIVSELPESRLGAVPFWLRWIGRGTGASTAEITDAWGKATEGYEQSLEDAERVLEPGAMKLPGR